MQIPRSLESKVMLTPLGYYMLFNTCKYMTNIVFALKQQENIYANTNKHYILLLFYKHYTVYTIIRSYGVTDTNTTCIIHKHLHHICEYVSMLYMFYLHIMVIDLSFLNSEFYY